MRMEIDQWFESNKYSAEQFSDLRRLAKAKKKTGLKVSCVVPTLNEQGNIGKVVSEIKKLARGHKLVDEIVVVDSGSNDRTVEEARSAGAEVYYASDILKKQGRAKGKGENLWKSLYITGGDIIAWVDADIKNIHEKFIYGLVGPLLTNRSIGFTKAFYKRPLRTEAGLIPLEGGRVTELLIRPLLNLYFPSLSGFIQPLSGEYAGRRSLLDKIPFFTGYGVETGMLIDIEKKFGLEAMAQVDIGERVHRNRPIASLSKMSFEILQAFSEKANSLGVFVNLAKINPIYTIIEPQLIGEETIYSLTKNPILTAQRPPIITLKEYRHKFGIGEKR